MIKLANVSVSCVRKQLKTAVELRYLWQHLQRYHKAKFIELNQQDEAKKAAPAKDSEHPKKPAASRGQISSFFLKPINVADNKKIDNSVLYFITKDIQPFSVVKDEGFCSTLML